MRNLQTVQAMYEAFGKGDIPAILQHMDPQVDWEYIAPSVALPWLQRRRGPAGVGAFFEALQGLEFHTFTPTQFFEDGDTVAVLFDLEVTVKSTGKRIVEHDEVHVWHFGPGGKVVRFRHVLDTHAQWMAYRAVA
jgi:hypothetical protein